MHLIVLVWKLAYNILYHLKDYISTLKGKILKNTTNLLAIFVTVPMVKEMIAIFNPPTSGNEATRQHM